MTNNLQPWNLIYDEYKKYRWLIIAMLVVAFFISSVSVYGFAYYGLYSLSSIGTSTPQGNWVIGTTGTVKANDDVQGGTFSFDILLQATSEH